MIDWLRIDCLFYAILFHFGSIQIFIKNSKNFVIQVISFNFVKNFNYSLYHRILKPFSQKNIFFIHIGYIMDFISIKNQI